MTDARFDLAPLVERLVAARDAIEGIVGGACLVVNGAGFPLTPPTVAYPDRGQAWSILLGWRALVVITFPQLPPWLPRVKGLRNRGVPVLEGEWTLVVPDPTVAVEDRAPAALASFLDYAEVVIDAYLTMHPQTETCLPIFDQTAFERIFH
ncbi:hypothetical protein LVJ94_48825 [Pendulispora rubella]|uniref:Uncharacterized protein n=1 Tax=Pendulispora rubella TaxID=2741070 RepID=A0ABZ2L1R2_9BACT